MPGPSCLFAAVALALVQSAMPQSALIIAKAEIWKYDGQPQSPLPGRAAYRSLALTEERPTDVQERATYRGSSRRYGQLRYGTENSTRVIIVVDEHDDGQFDLYVDCNRDRAIEADELTKGTGRTRTLQLDVEIDRGDSVSRESRSVVFRRGITGKTLAVATLGHVAGSLVLADEKTTDVRRVDGDGNGLFSDSSDRIWLDLDDSGTWDPFGEQFPHKPVLHLGGQRFAVRADRLGHRLTIERIEGVGRILVELADDESRQRVSALRGMLIGDDGSAFAFGRGQTVAVPVGRYALGSVSITLEDGDTTLPWNFTFSRFSRPTAWRTVAQDRQVTIDPVGQMRFDLELDQAPSACRPGARLVVRPRLYTQDGLLVNASSRGETDRKTDSNHNQASIAIKTVAGVSLEHANSGFA